MDFLILAKPITALLDVLAYAVTALVGSVWYYLSGGKHS